MKVLLCLLMTFGLSAQTVKVEIKKRPTIFELALEQSIQLTKDEKVKLPRLDQLILNNSISKEEIEKLLKKKAEILGNDNERRGDEAGNGGFVIKNPNGHELYDYKEFFSASKLRANKHNSAINNAHSLIQIIAKLDHRLYEELFNRLSGFMKNTEFLLNSPYPYQRRFDLQSNSLSNFPFGGIIQAAMNIKIDEKRLYFIQYSLWKDMNSVQQAGLILHEIIYGLYLDKGLEYDHRTRFLVDYISRQSILDDSLYTFSRVLDYAGLADVL